MIINATDLAKVVKRFFEIYHADKNWDLENHKYILDHYAVAKQLEAEKLIPEDTWYFFSLSMEWSNDLNNWADTILSGKKTETMFEDPNAVDLDIGKRECLKDTD